MSSLSINIGLTIAQTTAEGPGLRYALWVQGCSLHCKSCCNPELLSFTGGNQVLVEDLVKQIIATPDIQGISILGGEPLEQPEAVAELCYQMHQFSLSVMIYTGYTLAELQAMSHPAIDKIITYTDLLVDGRYIRELPDTKRRWIGSTNQSLHFLTNRYQSTDPCFYESDTIEIRLDNKMLIINGKPWGKGLL